MQKTVCVCARRTGTDRTEQNRTDTDGGRQTGNTLAGWMAGTADSTGSYSEEERKRAILGATESKTTASGVWSGSGRVEDSGERPAATATTTAVPLCKQKRQHFPTPLSH